MSAQIKKMTAIAAAVSTETAAAIPPARRMLSTAVAAPSRLCE